MHLALFQLSIVALFFALYCGYLLITLRKTQMRLLEKEKLLDRNAHLLIKKTTELMDENIEQQRLLESRGDFVGIVSHQLRTPATEIVWSVDGIKSDKKGRLSADQKLFVQKLDNTGHRMVRIIDHLLRLVNLEQAYSRISTDPYEADSVLSETAQATAKEFVKKKIKLVMDLHYGKPLTTMDADSLSMAVGNLVENAFFYTPNKGMVTVRSEASPEGGLTVSVEDTGIGISLEKQKNVFKKFQRSEAARRMNSGGMGLGLYIVKNVVERHGGSVDFETREDVGTTFRFTLPPKRVRLR